MLGEISKEVIKNHHRAELRKARRPFVCDQSGQPINPGEYYYRVYPVGSGVSGMVNADRILPEHLDAFLAKWER